MDADGVKAAASVVCVLAAAAIGYYAGYMTRDSMQVDEDVTPAPEERLPGGGLKLERTLQSAPEAQELPAAPVPPGATVERRVRVVAQPVSDADELPACDCPPVTVDLALIREGDGRRVITWSPDGKIFGGLDVPIVPHSVFANRKWAAGISHEPFRELYGGWVDRDLGRIRVGAEIQQYEFREERGVEVWLKVGWTF